MPLSQRAPVEVLIIDLVGHEDDPLTSVRAELIQRSNEPQERHPIGVGKVLGHADALRPLAHTSNEEA